MLMQERLREHLLTLFEAGAVHLKLGFLTMSVRANGDGRFYRKLRERQGTFTVMAYDKAVAWFSSVWPAEREWPRNIERIYPSELPARPKRRRRASAPLPAQQESANVEA